MKKILNEVLITLIYLTPIGYLINLYKLQTGKRTPGVYIHLTRDEPVVVVVKQNPIISERLQWFGNGIALIFQSLFITSKNLGGSLGGGYAWVALLYGLVNLISALFPNFNWNNTKLGKVNISIIAIVLVTALIFVTVFGFFQSKK